MPRLWANCQKLSHKGDLHFWYFWRSRHSKQGLRVPTTPNMPISTSSNSKSKNVATGQRPAAQKRSFEQNQQIQENKQMKYQLDQWINGWKNGREEWTRECLLTGSKTCLNEWKNEWMSDWVGQWVSEWLSLPGLWTCTHHFTWLPILGMSKLIANGITWRAKTTSSLTLSKAANILH